MRTSRGIFTSVMMKEPLATVPRWYRTSLRTEDRMGVTGSRFLSLKHKVLFDAGRLGSNVEPETSRHMIRRVLVQINMRTSRKLRRGE